MRISDWSSDVCSSDLILGHAIAEHIEALREEWAANPLGGDIDSILAEYDTVAVEIERNSAYNRMLVALFFSVNPIGPALESIRNLPADRFGCWLDATPKRALLRSEEHTSELQSLMRKSYAVFCLKKKQSRNLYTHYKK